MSTRKSYLRLFVDNYLLSAAIRRQIWLVGVVDISVDSPEGDLSAVLELFLHVVTNVGISDIGIAALLH